MLSSDNEDVGKDKDHNLPDNRTGNTCLDVLGICNVATRDNRDSRAVGILDRKVGLYVPTMY